MPNETEISQEIFKRLDVIGESMKTGAIKFSEVAVKGAFTEGIGHAAYVGVGAVVLGVSLSLFCKSLKIVTDSTKSYSAQQDAIPTLCIGAVCSMIGAAIFMANLNSAIMGMVSPEWVALKNVLQLMK